MFALFKRKPKKTAFLPLYIKMAKDIKEGNLLTPAGNKYAKQTGYNYTTGVHILREFEKAKGTIFLEDISIEWADKLTLWMMEKGYTKNTIGAAKRRVKAVLKRLYNSKISTFDGRGITANTEQVTTVYSTIEDLQALMVLDLSETPGLQRVRDIYILQCFVGLRFSDLLEILRSPNQYLRTIGTNLFFEIKTKKTGEIVVIPVGRSVKFILDKYSYNFGACFTYQYYNLAIKDIAERAGITQEVIFTRTEGGMRVDTPRLKFSLMSSHTARRTFATNAFLSGLPEKNIMMITGHKTSQSFYRYIRCSNLDAAIKIANHEFFNIELPLFVETLLQDDKKKEIANEPKD